jgi:hypothetical protein
MNSNVMPHTNNAPTDEAVLAEAKQLAQLIASSLPEKIQIAALPLNSKLPFKALSLRELLIHRVSDLADTAVELFEQRRLIPAVLLTRGVIETVAVAFSLYKALERFVGSHDVAAFDEFLMKGLMGGRLEDSSYRATNVVTLVQHVEKTIPGFESSYNWLSEFAHPNWAGMLGAFGEIDRESFELLLGPNQRTSAFSTGVNALSGSLLVFHHFYNGMAEMLQHINQHFDSQGETHAA